MGFNNRIEEGCIHFLTLTVVDWIDVFTRLNHKMEIVNSLKYCQKEKGLEIYAWVLMSNHLHLIASAANEKENTLSDILRDFKKFTSKKIIDNIIEEPESRRDWMLDRFEFAGRNDKKIKYYKFWREGNEPKPIITNAFFIQKIEYIHQNPVKQWIVSRAVDYLFSSASNYAGEVGLLDVILFG
jgi:putative transposase